MQCLAVVVRNVSVCRLLHCQARYIFILTIDYLVGVQRSSIVGCVDFLLVFSSTADYPVYICTLNVLVW